MIKSRCYQLSEVGPTNLRSKSKALESTWTAGLVKNKAKTFSELAPPIAAEKLTNKQASWLYLKKVNVILFWLDAGKKESYLQVSKLASLADDKENKDQVIRNFRSLRRQ